MRARLVLFDVDGTLVDTAGAGRRSLQVAFHEVLGLDGVEELTGGVRMAGKTDPVIVEDMARAAGIPAEEARRRVPEVLAAYVRALREEMARPDPRRRSLPGVQALLEILEGRPEVAMGLLTGNVESGARSKLEPFGLNRFFPDGGFSSDHPDRIEIARLAREKVSRRLGRPFPPESVWVVGDTELDVECAHANGFRALAVASGWVPIETLAASRPEILLPDLTDLRVILEALELQVRP